MQVNSGRAIEEQERYANEENLEFSALDFMTNTTPTSPCEHSSDCYYHIECLPFPYSKEAKTKGKLCRAGNSTRTKQVARAASTPPPPSQTKLFQREVRSVSVCQL
ncbi:unnamed protein product [Orchesella dallaii]|uniref:Uncharacterized protein n=1 Tax=Orchesella dallaii TaxID=48710 RepID=A0ABP1RFQ8_9HEXA